LPSWQAYENFTFAKQEFLNQISIVSASRIASHFIKSIVAIYIIRLVLKHNLFIHYLKITIKFIGLDIEIKSKEKDAPSDKE